MVVFFDIDGTIVDEKTQQIPQSAIDAVSTLTERGHIPVINTGRPYCHIDPRVRQMAFPAWVCGCGMEVLYQGNWLSRQHPGDDLCAYVIRRARECGMLTLYEAQEGAIVLDGSYALHPAIQLEKTMSKEEILQAYLNTINLGQNTLGIQAASNRYFGKDVSELSVACLLYTSPSPRD